RSGAAPGRIWVSVVVGAEGDDSGRVDRGRIVSSHYADSLLVIVRVSLGQDLDGWCEIPSHSHLTKVNHRSATLWDVRRDQHRHSEYRCHSTGCSVGLQHVPIHAVGL